MVKNKVKKAAPRKRNASLKKNVKRRKKKNGCGLFFTLFLLAVCTTCLVYFTDKLIIQETHPLMYTSIVEKYSHEYNVPAYVISAVIEVESGHKKDVVSSKGAIGLMQITPETFEWLCNYTDVGGEYDENKLYDPETNIKYGTYFLSYLYEKYGVWETAHAAYNAGISRINGWLKDENISKDGRLVKIPIKETREYVEKIIMAKKVYRETYYSD